jgi:long-subunit fatty acid transport protein
MSRSLRSLTPLAVAALLLLTAATARAGGLVVPDQGTRRTGMAAVVGRPDEPAAVFHNPAGLTLLDGARLYVAFGFCLLDMKFRLRPWAGSDRYLQAPVDGAGYYPAAKPTQTFGVMPMVVGTVPLGTPRLVGALGFYMPGATGAVFDADGVTRFHVIKTYILAPLGSVSLAWRALPWLSLGASVGAFYVRIYGRRLVFPADDQQATLLGSQSELEINGSAVAPAWNFGLLVQPLRVLSLGLALTGRSDVHLSGPVHLRFGPDALIPTTLDGTQHTSLLIPWTLAAGAAWDVARHVEVAADVRYLFYRQVKSQHTDVTGLELITALDTPKNYHDSWQVSGGARVHHLPRVPALELMLGAHYDRTPAPGSTVSFDQPSFSHVGFHTGARYSLGERYRLGLTLLHYRYLVPTVNDSLTSPPSNFTGAGGNTIITASFEAVLGRARRAAPASAPAATGSR